ncbi:MAG: alpha/beta hydrolase [Pseudomonadota bacterium]
MQRLVLALLMVCAGWTTSTSTHADLILEPCRIDAGPAMSTAKAQCGTLQVAENPEEPNGNQIDLSIALVPALSVNPAPDPLVMLAGGPGQSAISSYLANPGIFEEIRQKHPILLVDQRGTGRSNLMTCEATEDDLVADWDLSLVAEEIRECIATLPGDPALYTTSIAVNDLDQVRQALGIEQLNLWGGSYGTRVALHYLRRYPESTRTVIVDGVAPPEELLGPMLAIDAQASLQALNERCRRTPECFEQFGDVQAMVETLQARFDEATIEYTTAHPRTGELTPVPLSSLSLGGVIRLSIYAPATRAILPLMLSQAVAEDYRLLASQALLIQDAFDGEMAGGMHNSVVCAEDMPFFKEADRPDGIDDTFMRASSLDLLLAICAEWPQGPMDADFHDPLVSDKPILVLSGEFDPVTPPSNGEQLLASLSNAKHIVAPEQGHIISGLGCMPKLIAQFVTEADPAGIDATCVDKLGGMPFFVSPLGPTP